MLLSLIFMNIRNVTVHIMDMVEMLQQREFEFVLKLLVRRGQPIVAHPTFAA